MRKIRNIPLMVVLVVGMGAQALLAANQPTVIDNITGVSTQMQGGLPASARKNMNTVSQTTPGGYPLNQTVPGGYPLNQTTPGGYPLQGVASPQMYMEKSMRPTVLDAPPAWAQDELPPAASLVLAPLGANLFQGNFDISHFLPMSSA